MTFAGSLGVKKTIIYVYTMLHVRKMQHASDWLKTGKHLWLSRKNRTLLYHYQRKNRSLLCQRKNRTLLNQTIMVDWALKINYLSTLSDHHG